MTQVVNHKGKRLKVGPRGGGYHIYVYVVRGGGNHKLKPWVAKYLNPTPNTLTHAKPQCTLQTADTKAHAWP